MHLFTVATYGFLDVFWRHTVLWRCAAHAEVRSIELDLGQRRTTYQFCVMREERQVQLRSIVSWQEFTQVLWCLALQEPEHQATEFENYPLRTGSQLSCCSRGVAWTTMALLWTCDVVWELDGRTGAEASVIWINVQQGGRLELSYYCLFDLKSKHVYGSLACVTVNIFPNARQSFQREVTGPYDFWDVFLATEIPIEEHSQIFYCGCRGDLTAAKLHRECFRDLWNTINSVLVSLIFRSHRRNHLRISERHFSNSSFFVCMSSIGVSMMRASAAVYIL